MTIDTAALRELCENATPPPWRKLMVLSGKQDFFLLQADGCSNILKREDADFAITARTALPEVMDRVEALEWLVEVSEFYHNHPVSEWWTVQFGNAAKEALAIYNNALRDAGYGG